MDGPAPAEPWVAGPSTYIDRPMNPPVGSATRYPVMAPIEFFIATGVPVVIGFMIVTYDMLWALMTWMPRFDRSDT